MDASIQNPQVAGLLTGRPGAVTTPTSSPNISSGSDFAALLENQLKVSGHAQTRLQSRNIQLTQSEWSRVADGVNKAAAKGAKESLVMVDNVALVVSVKNRTVITAVDQNHLKDNVFTNIDSAVIV